MTVAQERRLRPRGAQACRAPRSTRRVADGARPGRPRRPRRAPAVAALRRPAAARRARAHHRDRAEGAAARRAAVQSRRQAARAGAPRAARPAAAARPHHDLRHPRPGRGEHDLRPHRGDERGRHPAGRHADGALRAPGQSLRRELPRHRQHPGRQRRRRGRRTARAGHRSGRRQLVFRPQHADPVRAGRALRGPVTHREFLGATVRYGVRVADSEILVDAPFQSGSELHAVGDRSAWPCRPNACSSFRQPERWYARQASSPPPTSAPRWESAAGRAAGRRGFVVTSCEVSRDGPWRIDVFGEGDGPTGRDGDPRGGPGARPDRAGLDVGRTARHRLGRREPALLPALRRRAVLGPSLARCRGMPAGLLPLRIDAGLAFGTGTHATTRGCLEMLATLDPRRDGQRRRCRLRQRHPGHRHGQAMAAAGARRRQRCRGRRGRARERRAERRRRSLPLRPSVGLEADALPGAATLRPYRRQYPGRPADGSLGFVRRCASGRAVARC